MNCETIDSILDDHRVARLGSPERRDVDAHLRSCDRCAEAWTAQHLLTSERFGTPPTGLFERLASGLDAAKAAPQRATVKRRRWLAPALAASMLVAMAVTIWGLPEMRFIVSPDSKIRFGWTVSPVPQRDAETVSAPVPVPTPKAPSAAPRELPRAAPTFAAGVDYELVGQGSLPAISGGRTQVVEFFAWWCNPCYVFDSQLERWKQIVEPRIEVVRIPVVWNERGELHARAYYTAAALGKLDVVHGPAFAEIHERGNPLLSPEAWAKLFAAYGVDFAMFNATFNSSAVDAQVERAAALGREYGITSTPTLVVGGRYVTNPTLAGSANRMFAIAESLSRSSVESLRERTQERICDRTVCSNVRASEPIR